tara:strand:+ start:157 stop:1119 length:963 start_codon:yes stop_codon:yes gene_type:complete
MNEVQLIDKYLKRLTKKNNSSQGLNDDIFFDKSKKLAVSIDTYVEKVHFPNFKSPDLVIKKILRSSLSDLICKGVKPKYYFISASGNSKSFSNKNLKKISNSLSLEQRRFDIELSGGDTVYSNTNSFTCCVVGYSNKIVKRHKSIIGDDIYITGHLGDSFIGLQILKKKISVPKSLKKYFISKFYMPSINLKMVNFLQKFANTSIDISDGLLIDLKKMTRQQKYGFSIRLDDIELSNQLKKVLSKNKRFKIENTIFNGDDYEIIFTSHKKNRSLINKYAKNKKLKIQRIGIILKKHHESCILKGNKKFRINKNPGYTHQF